MKKKADDSQLEFFKWQYDSLAKGLFCQKTEIPSDEKELIRSGKIAYKRDQDRRQGELKFGAPKQVRSTRSSKRVDPKKWEGSIQIDGNPVPDSSG